MKSRRRYRFWFMSLAIHLCLAIVFSFITINQINSRDDDALNVSILKVNPVKPVEKLPHVKTPTVVPIIPMPDLEMKPQLTSGQSRALTTRPRRSNSVFTTKSVAVDTLVSQSLPQSTRAEISVQGIVRTSRADRHPAQPFGTAADLPIQSNAPLATGLSGGGSLSDGEEGGGSVGHSAFSSGGNMDGTRESGRVGLTSLLDVECLSFRMVLPALSLWDAGEI